MNAHNGILTRLNTNGTVGPNPPRTESVEGYYEEEPCVGLSFVIIGEALDPKFDRRYFATSIIQAVRETPDGWEFDTMNSSYKLVKVLNG